MTVLNHGPDIENVSRCSGCRNGGVAALVETGFRDEFRRLDKRSAPCIANPHSVLEEAQRAVDPWGHKLEGDCEKRTKVCVFYGHLASDRRCVSDTAWHRMLLFTSTARYQNSRSTMKEQRSTGSPM